MVFRRISTGCDECRLQHTKCDGGSPSCGRCLRRNIVCPGYRHVGGFVFKIQTTQTRKLEGRLQCQRTRSDAPIRECGLGFTNPDHFIAFFFTTYIFAGRRNDASCGLFDHTPTLCRLALPNSALTQAASVLGATTFILSHRLDENHFSWYHELRFSAIKAIQYDINCKRTQLRNDTLMAVLLHDFTEVIIRAHMNSTAPLSHQHGALALLKLRGPLNFVNEEALSLYNAARYATLRGNARSAKATSTLRRLHSLVESRKIDQAPAISLLDTLDKLDELQHACQTAMSQNQSLDHLYDSALEVQTLLDAWTASLPTRWEPRTVAIEPPMRAATSSMVEQYESMDIAVVYNLWRCACLKMVKLRQAFFPNTLPHPQPLEGEAGRIFDQIRRAVPVFLGWLQKPDCVEQDVLTGAWKELRHRRTRPGVERFPGDYLGKWFLSDLLRRLDQIIGYDPDSLAPKLHISPERLLFLREQKRILLDLSPRTTQLTRIFSECATIDWSYNE